MVSKRNSVGGKIRENDKIFIIGVALIILVAVYSNGHLFSLIPVGTLCSGNQTTWSSCPIPQPPANTTGTTGNLTWASATSKGALLSDGQVNTGTSIYFATLVSATNTSLEKPLDLSSSDITFYEYGLVQGTYCNINIYYPTNYTQPYASILAIEENNASIAAFGSCGAGDLGTFANDYIKTQTPSSLLGETAQISLSPAAISTNYTGDITFYATGLMPETSYQLVSTTASQGGGMTGIVTQTSSSAGDFTYTVPAYDVVSQTPTTYTFSLLNTNTGNIQYASVKYTVSNSPIALPVNYKLTLVPSTGGYIGIINTTAGTATPVIHSQSQLVATYSNVTLEEQPLNSYEFAGWIGTGAGSYSGTNTTITVKMAGNVTEIANFVLNTPPPTTSAPTNLVEQFSNFLKFISNPTNIWNWLTHL